MLDIMEALFLSGSYNARLVSLATSTGGLAVGCLGVYLLYRRKSLVADALSHATLPGVAVGFILAYLLLGEGRNEWFIFGGAFVSMLIALLFIQYLNRWIKQDSSIALALSGFYALGVALLSYIQSMPSGASAGLETFILGQSATINLAEARLISGGALLVLIVSLLFHKEWTLLCFDPSYALSQKYPLSLLDFSLMICAGIVIAIGIKSMGLILIVALLTIPALTSSLVARSWRGCILMAGLLAALASHIGTAISVGLEGVPSGVAIVLVSGVFYLIVFSRHVLARFLTH